MQYKLFVNVILTNLNNFDALFAYFLLIFALAAEKYLPNFNLITILKNILQISWQPYPISSE